MQIMNDVMETMQINNSSISNEQLDLKVNGIYNRFVKRIIDFLLAIIGLIIMLPIFVLVSFAIIIDTGFPVLYKAQRGGYRNKAFKIYKFRSMVQNADKLGGYTTALHDKRITRVGYVLRKTKLDEIPQLINIIKGEMSFVGPRPEVLAYVDKFEGVEKYILQVRPGITDYSSLRFANMDATVGDGDVDTYFVNNILSKKNALRVKYVHDISFFTDMKIFFRTVVHILGQLFFTRKK